MSVISIFKPCLSKQGYAILKLLDTFGSLSFTQLHTCLQISEGNFEYYLGKLKSLGIVNTDSITKLYHITPKGSKILEAIDSAFPEKFMSEDLNDICINSKNEEHSFTKINETTVCRFCAHVHKRKVDNQ